MKYEIVWYDKNLQRHVKTYAGTYDGARKTACDLITKGAKYSVYISRPPGSIGDRLGEVWKSYNEFSYLSNRAGEGIIWKVNPKTGKLTSKVGFVE